MTDQTEANDRCVKCGHPRNNHPYRHPFQSLRNPMTARESMVKTKERFKETIKYLAQR